MDEDYLLNKRYVNKDVYVVKNDVNKYLDEQAKFRQFMEDKNLDYDDIDPENDIDEDLVRDEKPLSVRYKNLEKSEKRIQIRRNLEQGNIDFFKNYNQSNDLGSVNLRPTQPMIRFTQEKRHLYHFDSRNRNKILYPEQNSYKIILKKTYTNVVAIKLKSSEFINSQQLIRNTPFNLKNNILKWQMGDNGEPDDGNVYTTTLTPGNYSASQLSLLIQNSMNSVIRTNGKLNNYNVTIDVVTDLVQVSSIDNVTLSNPFSFTASDNVTTINVSYNNANSNFSIGQNVFISGSSSIGGISSSIINGTHIITDITLNTFSFIVYATSTSDIIEGGGNSVEIGRGLLFRLLFSDEQTPYSILGFPNQDTPFSTTVTNNIEKYNYIKILEDDEITTSIVPSTTTNINLYNPNSDYLNKTTNENDQFSASGVLGVYNMDEDSEYILSKNGNVRLSIKSVSKPSLHGLDPSEDNIYSVITTNLPHNLGTGDRIYIYNENTREFDNSDFSGFMGFKHLYGLDLNNALTDVEENNLSKFVTEITNSQGLFIITDSNLDNDTYKFKVSIPYISIPLIDDRIEYLYNNNYFNGVDYTSNIFKEDYLFGNIILTQVNQNLNLSGEKYILMTSSIIGGDESTGETDNIFAKIQLAASSGSNIFNAYIGGYKYFYDSPLPILKEIDIQFYSNNGELFEFYDNDHSFTLEITEAIQKIEGTGFSSQIGTKS